MNKALHNITLSRKSFIPLIFLKSYVRGGNRVNIIVGVFVSITFFESELKLSAHTSFVLSLDGIVNKIRANPGKG